MKERAFVYQDCQEMAFGQGIPTARDKRMFCISSCFGADG
jgi:hypothetical protein